MTRRALSGMCGRYRTQSPAGWVERTCAVHSSEGRFKAHVTTKGPTTISKIAGMPPRHDHQHQASTMNATVSSHEAMNAPNPSEIAKADASVPQSQPCGDAGAGGCTFDVSNPTLQSCAQITEAMK